MLSNVPCLFTVRGGCFDAELLPGEPSQDDHGKREETAYKSLSTTRQLAMEWHSGQIKWGSGEMDARWVGFRCKVIADSLDKLSLWDKAETVSNSR